MPDQFETIWNLIAYVAALFYCYYVTVYQDMENQILTRMFASATLVGLICVLHYFKIDIYRFKYAGENYYFTFSEGTVYGLAIIHFFLYLCLRFSIKTGK